MKFFDVDRLSYPVRRLIHRAATLAGIGLLVGAGLDAGASIRAVRNGQQMMGHVVALGSKPFVSFKRPDGQETVFRPTGPVWLHAGDNVPVLVDVLRPAAPPVVATPVALWLAPGIMGVVGALLFNFGFNNKDRPDAGRPPPAYAAAPTSRTRSMKARRPAGAWRRLG